MKGLKALASVMVFVGLTVSVPYANAETNLRSGKSGVYAQVSSNQINSGKVNPTQATGSNRGIEGQLEEGFKLFQAKQYAQAVNTFSRVIEVDPSNPYAYLGRGGSYFGLNEYRKAKTDLDTSIRLNSGISYAYFFRGLTNYGLGNQQGAVSDLQTAANLFEKDGEKEMAQKSLEIVSKIRNV